MIYAFCRPFDQSAYWRYLVPGAAGQLKLHVVRRKSELCHVATHAPSSSLLELTSSRSAVGDNAQARIDVYGATIIRTQESASAMLPFSTVPILQKIGEKQEVDVSRMKWTWTFDALQVDPASHCVTRSSWTVSDGDSKIAVTLHRSDNGERMAAQQSPLRARPDAVSWPGRALYAAATDTATPHALPPPVYPTRSERRAPDEGAVECEGITARRAGQSSVLSRDGVERLDDPSPFVSLLPQYATPLSPKPVQDTRQDSHNTQRPYFPAELPRYNGVILHPRPRSYESEQVYAHRKKRTLQERVEEQIGDLLHHLGWPSAQSTFRGKAAAPPRFSAARYHQVLMDRSGLRHVVEITVEMDGIWQLGRPANGQGHARGRLLEDARALLPFFGLPGAANAPRNMTPVELLIDNISAADMCKLDAVLSPGTLISALIHKGHRLADTPGLVPVLTWRLTSRTGVENQRGSVFQGAFSPTKTTWTATSPDRNGTSKSAPLLVVHFVRSSKYEPVKRYQALTPGEVFSVGHARRQEQRRGRIGPL